MIIWDFDVVFNQERWPSPSCLVWKSRHFSEHDWWTSEQFLLSSLSLSFCWLSSLPWVSKLGSLVNDPPEIAWEIITEGFFLKTFKKVSKLGCPSKFLLRSNHLKTFKKVGFGWWYPRYRDGITKNYRYRIKFGPGPTVKLVPSVHCIPWSCLVEFWPLSKFWTL